MSKKKKGNSYAKKDAKKKTLNSITHHLETKGDIKNSMLETGKDILIGVVGGGLIGAAIGKPSLIIGIGVTGTGHYTGNRLATLLGIGMMAANGFQQSKSVQGLDGMDMQSIKGRLTAYKDNFIEKTYIDKVLHKTTPSGKQTKEETSGFGDLQFFNPTGSRNTYNQNHDLTALDSIQRQIEESGMAHMQMNGLGLGDSEEFGNIGSLGEMGDLSLVDATDFNL